MISLAAVAAIEMLLEVVPLASAVPVHALPVREDPPVWALEAVAVWVLVAAAGDDVGSRNEFIGVSR